MEAAGCQSGNSAPRFYAVRVCIIGNNSEETEMTSSSGDSDTPEDDLSYLEDIPSDSQSLPQDGGCRFYIP